MIDGLIWAWPMLSAGICVAVGYAGEDDLDAGAVLAAIVVGGHLAIKVAFWLAS